MMISSYEINTCFVSWCCLFLKAQVPKHSARVANLHKLTICVWKGYSTSPASQSHTFPCFVFTPWIEERPHCGCWGHKRNNEPPLSCSNGGKKEGNATGILPTDFNGDFTRLCFSHWLNQWQATKRETTLLFCFVFFFLSRGRSFASLKCEPMKKTRPLPSPFWCPVLLWKLLRVGSKVAALCVI